MSGAKQRIEYIDLAKGICILLVVWGHVSENVFCLTGRGIESSLTSYCTSFRMPLYFFLSGLFFKAYGGGWNFVIKKLNRLLIPFASFFILSWLVSWVLCEFGLSGDKTFKGFYSLLAFYTEEPMRDGPIWFLLCLFEVNLMYYAIYLLCKEKVAFVVPLVLFIGGVGYCFYFEKVLDLPMYIDRAMYFLPFFVVGGLVRKHTNFMYYGENIRNDVWMLFLCVVAFVALHPQSAFLFSKTNIFTFYVLGVLGTFVVLLLAKILKKIPVISYIGRYSIVMLCLHAFPLPFLSKILGKYISDGAVLVWSEFLIVTLGIAAITPLCIKYFPYIFAQKDLIKIKE